MNIIKWLDEHFEEVLIAAFSFVMVAVIVLQVFMRYALSSSLTWSEELARYCFIWIVYLGVSYGVKHQRHIKVDALLTFLSNKGRIILSIFSNIIFLVFAIIVIIYGNQIAMQQLGYGQVSAGLGIPMFLVYYATPVGMVLTSIRIVQQLVLQIRTLLGKEDFKVMTEQDLILEEEKNANEKGEI